MFAIRSTWCIFGFIPWEYRYVISAKPLRFGDKLSAMTFKTYDQADVVLQLITHVRKVNGGLKYKRGRHYGNKISVVAYRIPK